MNAELLEKAKNLGQLIGKTRVCLRYKSLSMDVNAKAENKKLLDEYMELVHDVKGMVYRGDTPDEAKKKRYEELARKINSDAKMKDYLAAQEEYLSVIHAVIDRITEM